MPRTFSYLAMDVSLWTNSIRYLFPYKRKSTKTDITKVPLAGIIMSQMLEEMNTKSKLCSGGMSSIHSGVRR